MANRGPLLAEYVGIVRKHWLLIVLIGAAVLAAGWFYHSRQVPAFRAAAKLKIIREPLRRSSKEVTYSFEEDQVFYNTQYNLLTSQPMWADRVLDRAAYVVRTRLGKDAEGEPGEAARKALVGRHGGDLLRWLGCEGGEIRGHLYDLPEDLSSRADPALRSIRKKVIEGLWGYDDDAFLAGVRARPIPNTYLSELTFEARDPGIAVFFVNLYAEFYRDLSRGEREDTLAKQRERLIDQRKWLDEHLLKDARQARKDAEEEFRKKYAHLGLENPKNLAEQEVESLAGRIAELEREQIEQRPQKEHVCGVLAAAGVRVLEPREAVEPKEGVEFREVPVTLELSGEGDDGRTVAEVLVDDLGVLALPVVEASDNVTTLRARIRNLEQERTLMPANLTEESLQVRRWRERLGKAESDLGREVEATIVRYLEAWHRTGRVIADLSERLGKTKKAAQEFNDLYAKVTETREEVARLEREERALDRDIEALKIRNDGKGGAATEMAGSLILQNIEVERPARLQDARQVRPNSMLIYVLTGLAALFLSFGSAFFIEFLDDTIKKKEDFDRLVGVPDTGYIPQIPDREKRDTYVLEKPRSGVAEAFRTVRTGILFSKRDQEIRSLLITSAGPSEGKTTVVVNLAITMAQAGRGPVLLVDADLRRARVHEALGLSNQVGLTNCLIGSATLDEAVCPTAVENLFVLPSGPAPPNPAELLGGQRMAEILEEASKTYGKILLDTPPLVAVTDTCLLALLVEGVFIVISLGKTSWRLIEQGKQALASVGREATGAILNNIRMRQRGYGYGYGYGYGHGYKGYYSSDEAE